MSATHFSPAYIYRMKTSRFGPFLLPLLSVLYGTACIHAQEPLPTTYEYFTADGIQSGLTADTRGFFQLNGKPFRIISGAMHYFRIHPVYWRDRLRKLRAMGANTVETYVPWNLHEPEKGVFDFGEGGLDFSILLDVRRFVQLAREEDLLVLFRPGPYICSEWEFGGLPSWLQRDPDMQVRTSYPPYLERVKLYFDQLLPRVSDLQFTKGGSIIALQLENEYGSFKPTHTSYLEYIKESFENHTFGESLFFTSDNRQGMVDGGPLPGTFITVNMQSDPDGNLGELIELQPNRPVMVMEYWAGWFDKWFQPHQTTSPDQFISVLETIFQYAGSVNFYMFHGGTSFGFLNGGTVIVSSYDYDAPLSEAGDYTEKYHRAAELIRLYEVPALARPPMPAETPKTAYPTLPLQRCLLYQDILARVPGSSRFTLPQPVTMEQLNMNGDSGQSYGYILYRKVFTDLGPGSKLRVGPVQDFGMLLVDGVVQQPPTADGSPYWMGQELEWELSLDGSASYLVDILVENTGRGNYGHAEYFLQQKGLTNGSILLNDVPVEGFQVIALELKSDWIRGLDNWRPVGEVGTPFLGPALFQSTFIIEGPMTPMDTWIDMRTWHRGVVFVNGFNLGRYFRVGPQQTLFVPAPLLRLGENTVTIFEQFGAGGSEIQFSAVPILDQNM